MHLFTPSKPCRSMRAQKQNVLTSRQSDLRCWNGNYLLTSDHDIQAHSPRYGTLSSRRVDLVGDYAGQELFLLEGDSLLLHCFADPRLDFNGMCPKWMYESKSERNADTPLDGFQLLHAAYAVEYFIQGLIQRKCNLKIVFFDDHKELCVPRNTSTTKRQKYLLARSAIIRHLRTNLQKSHPAIEVHVFQRIRSRDFIEFLKITGVYFVMCHDGANPVAASNDPAIQRLSDEAQGVVAQQESTRKLRFRAMICFLINQGYNVALINGLEWQDTKVSCGLIRVLSGVSS